jgi:hypothetical protein
MSHIHGTTGTLNIPHAQKLFQCIQCRINPLNAELNPIYHFLVLLGAHPILHVSRIRDNVVMLQMYKYATGTAGGSVDGINTKICFFM